MFNKHVPSVIRNMQQTQSPSLGWYKCNIDAFFSVQRNKVGIEMCTRDNQGLLSVLKWVNDLQQHNIDFEMDSKRVLDCLYGDKMNVSELAVVINDCRCLLTSDVNFHVKFIMRQTNEVVHSLARVASPIFN
ncbi:cytochrome p450 [Trifolium pratense]|uniref:Cytochrome p450 n=1 Tax=Trifolium pratense TaxID=57577 RepID=A0A2K3P0B1_TRIPR|nr:cytochrome p450 [Trifolium pratense]